MGGKENFFTSYKMIYPPLNHSMGWKSDYIFFEKIEKMSSGKNEILEEMFEELRSSISVNFPSFIYITNVTEFKNGSMYVMIRKKKRKSFR